MPNLKTDIDTVFSQPFPPFLELLKIDPDAAIEEFVRCGVIWLQDHPTPAMRSLTPDERDDVVEDAIARCLQKDGEPLRNYTNLWGSFGAWLASVAQSTCEAKFAAPSEIETEPEATGDDDNPIGDVEPGADPEAKLDNPLGNIEPGRDAQEVLDNPLGDIEPGTDPEAKLDNPLGNIEPGRDAEEALDNPLGDLDPGVDPLERRASRENAKPEPEAEEEEPPRRGGASLGWMRSPKLLIPAALISVVVAIFALQTLRKGGGPSTITTGPVDIVLLSGSDAANPRFDVLDLDALSPQASLGERVPMTGVFRSGRLTLLKLPIEVVADGPVPSRIVVENTEGEVVWDYPVAPELIEEGWLNFRVDPFTLYPEDYTIRVLDSAGAPLARSLFTIVAQ